MTTATTVDQKVRKLLDTQIADGRQIGVQACAYRYGERIVDASVGVMGPDDPRPVQPDSLFSSFSTSKGVAATAVHMLADRGLLDYDAPVAKYWPEFAANGKERVTVAQALSHQAGVHATPIPFTGDFVCDWQAGLDWVANGTPAWEPGTATGYHAFTWAWVVGGIVQGASGRHIRDFVPEEIAAPLGAPGEMFIGIPDGVEERLTTLRQPPQPANGGGGQPRFQLPDDHPMRRAMPSHDFSFNDMRIRKACLPSANGHFSARALARMYGALANGGEVDGVRLVSTERIPHMYRLTTDSPDRVIMYPVRKGIGFFLGGKAANGMHGAMGPRLTSFGHAGNGGSIAFADPEVGLSIAVTLNQLQPMMQGEGVALEVCNLIRNELGVNE